MPPRSKPQIPARTLNVQLRIEPEVAEVIEHVAYEGRRSATNMIRHILDLFVKEWIEENPNWRPGDAQDENS